MIPGCPMTVMIAKAECKDRRLYRLSARNIKFGVYRADDGAFLGLRTKFGTMFIDEEFHWDNDDEKGELFGSAKPVEEMPEELPADIVNDAHLDGGGCTRCDKDAEYVFWPEGGRRERKLSDGSVMLVEGQWQHVDGTRCDDMGGMLRTNEALYGWLVAMNAKYGKNDEEDDGKR